MKHVWELAHLLVESTNLWQQESQRLQYSNFDGEMEAVTKDTDERSSDIDDRWLEGIGTGSPDHLSQTDGCLLLLLLQPQSKVWDWRC